VIDELGVGILAVGAKSKIVAGLSRPRYGQIFLGSEEIG